MANPTNNSTVTRWTNTILIVFFALLLALPTLDAFFQVDWTPPPNENRALAGFPEFEPGGAGLPAYLAGVEAWFNDHFGFRKCLVQWNNKLRWSLFKDKNTRKVLIGQDGWLFTTDNQMIDHYNGQLQFTPEQLHDWQVLLEKRRDWLAQRGIGYLFVVTPDKEAIYPEYLPEWVVKINPQTKLDQFFAYMKTNSTVAVLDLRETVRAAKSISPTYLKTDTHWNFFGAFMAYQELVPSLAKLAPALDLKPVPPAAFYLTNALQPGGDLTKILGLGMVESNEYLLVPKPGLPDFKSRLAPPDRPKEPKFTRNPLAKGSVIFFHDSFALSWLQFLGYNFNRAIYLWQYDLDSAWIGREKPDLVVSEMNERFFDVERPKKLMAKEALK